MKRPIDPVQDRPALPGQVVCSHPGCGRGVWISVGKVGGRKPIKCPRHYSRGPPAPPLEPLLDGTVPAPSPDPERAEQPEEVVPERTVRYRKAKAKAEITKIRREAWMIIQAAATIPLYPTSFRKEAQQILRLAGHDLEQAEALAVIDQVEALCEQEPFGLVAALAAGETAAMAMLKRFELIDAALQGLMTAAERQPSQHPFASNVAAQGFKTLGGETAVATDVVIELGSEEGSA